MASSPASASVATSAADEDSIERGLLHGASSRLPRLSGRASGFQAAAGLLMAMAVCVALLSERGLLGNSVSHSAIRHGAAAGTISLQGAQCFNAQEGDECYTAVTWAMTTGVKGHRDWYTGLSEQSSFADFQEDLYKKGRSNCQQPCQGAPAPAAPAAAAASQQALANAGAAGVAAAAGGECLCLFDVDRTLTTQQGEAAQCPGSEAYAGVTDTAYQPGELVISPVGKNLQQTQCAKCHRGIISMGDASGPDMKAILQQGGNFPDQDPDAEWSTQYDVHGPLIHGCPDADKPKCGKGIVDWFAGAKQIQIAPADVYFFDDHTGNTQGWDTFGFNARQISCASRDATMANAYGLCGAQLDEIVLQPGIHNCDQ